MNITKFEVKKGTSEIHHSSIKKGESLNEAFIRQDDWWQDADIIESFDTEKEAIEYMNVKTATIVDVRYNMGFAVKYDLVEVLFVEKNEYEEEDGEREWVGGGDIIATAMPF